jgi:HEAT repeat protein
VLQDGDPEVRRYAALAMSNIGGPQAEAAVPVLIDTLRRGDLDLRRAAAVALHNLGEVAAPAVPDLVKALSDTDPGLRKDAALALGGIGARAGDAVPWLVHLAANPKEPLDIRVEAAEALTGMGNLPPLRDKVPQLLKLLGDPDVHGDIRIRLAWLFNAFAEDGAIMTSAYPVFAKVCAEPGGKENLSPRYHCAFLLGVLQRQKAPDAAIDVLGEWLHDDTGRLYGRKRSSVGATGQEATGQATVQAVLQGDSRVMAVDALRLIGADRVRDRKTIVAQLAALAGDNKLDPELKKKTVELLKMVNR